jgi:trimeric autotransporter adhesin
LRSLRRRSSPCSSSSAWGGERGLDPSPSTIHFGDQVVGGRSKAQTITVTHRGGQPNIVDIRIDGENAGDFQITDASTCAPGPIEDGASCTVVVRFAPTQQGERSAMLGVLGVSGGKGVELSGTGKPASRLMRVRHS